MIDIVFPKGNEVEFVKQAIRLGYDSLCFCYRDKKTSLDLSHLKKKFSNIKFYSALVCKKIPAKSSGKLKKAKQYYDFYFVESNNRKYMKGKFRLIFNIEEDYDGMHQRHSGLNQVLCKLMAENNVIYGISFSKIWGLDIIERSGHLGRIMQNIKLCQKYKVNMILASFAGNPDQMRNPSDLESFLRLLGVKNAKACLVL